MRQQFLPVALIINVNDKIIFQPDDTCCEIMSTSNTGRRRLTSKLFSAEDEALDQIAREAEARLAARRQARAEAREIRMRELEKQQKEVGLSDEQSDRHYEHVSEPLARGVRTPRETPGTRAGSYTSGGSSYAGSRRSSEDSTEAMDSRELRYQVNDLEEKFNKAMVSYAQLDNEKTTLGYSVDTLKDEMEEMEENLIQLQKEHKDKSRVYDQLQRDYKTLKQENEILEECLKQRDKLIEENGLVLLGDNMVNGDIDGSSERSSPDSSAQRTSSKAVLVSQETANLLEQAGEGSLDVRLKRFAEEKQDLLDEIYRLRLDLEEERQKTSKMDLFSTGDNPHTNGPEMKLLEIQRESTKQVSDYKFKLKKAEQEITTLQGNVARLESQVTRYKTLSEDGEKVEDELKAERRKLQREFREAQARVEELETANAHLQKRIDKLKSVRNVLIKN